MSIVGKKQDAEHVRKRIAAGLLTRATNRKPRVRRPCSVQGCGAPSHCKSLCDKHYQRMCKYGSTDLPSRVLPPLAAIEASVEKTETGCWEWLKHRNPGGYGTLSYLHKSYIAHRFSWSAVHGPIPDGLQINHRCHNRACVNPDHLYAGTQAENVADMLRAGRANYARGVRSGVAKLADADVVEIRRSNDTTAQLARQLKVSESLVRAVRQNKIWRHVRAE